MKKINHIHEIELCRKEKVSSLLADLAISKVSLQQVLLTMGNIWVFEGSPALTGLPIVTNKERCNILVMGMICNYVLNNWEKVKKDAINYWMKTKKAGSK